MIKNAPILIIVVPLLTSLLNVILGLRWKALSFPLMLAALSVSAASSFIALNTVIDSGTIHYRIGGWAPPWGIEYVIDHLNGFVAVIVSFVSLVIAVYSKKSIEQEFPGKTVYFNSIFLLLVTGLLGIVVTGDIFNVYVFLEITSLAGYALVAIGPDKRAPLAAFNYVVMGTIGACFYLLGTGYLYIMTGTLNIADMSRLLPGLYHSPVIQVAFAFFMVGIAVKMALFPLHRWLPDAYTLAPSAVSALVASTMTKVGAYVMIRIMFTVFQPSFSLEVLPVMPILGWVAAAAALFGCGYAIAQTELKRMLAYILIAEVGYIVLGVSFANRTGLTGSILHILNDAFMMACLFLAVGAIAYKTKNTNIASLSQLHKTMPITMAALVVGGVSVVGIPPTAGFFSKWYLVLGAIEAGKWVFAAVLLISSLMTAVVFFRIIERVYFTAADPGHGSGAKAVMDEAPPSMLIPVLIMAAGILTLGFFSGRIINTVIQFAVPAAF